MKIDSVDFFYLSVPIVTEAADDSQDALLVRVTAGGHLGGGECDVGPAIWNSPTPAFVAPLTHRALQAEFPARR